MAETGESGQFQEKVIPHLRAAYNLARWLTRNDADAQDVVQEAYLRAFRFFPRFHGENALPWLLAIVRNTCYSWLQKNRAAQQAYVFDEAADSQAALEASAAVETEPEARLLRQADQQRIDRALANLPLQFREVVILRDMEDLSYQEIADITDCPLGTVMSRLSRARKLLRAYLQKEP